MEPFRPVIDLYVVENYERDLTTEVKAELLSLFSDEYRIEQGLYRLSSILALFVKTNLAILGGRAGLDDYLEFALDEE